MTDLLIIKLLHLLFFVYWLGGDLGTFYASRFLVRQGLTTQQRSIALTIMMGVDQGPRLCMPLILASGIHLAVGMGMLQAPAALVPVVWLIASGWFAMVLLLHFGHGRSYVPSLTRFDFIFRILVILCCVGAATAGSAAALMTDRMAVKLVVFAALVACGLGIRLSLKPFGLLWAQMLSQGISEQGDSQLRAALAKARRYVYLIWAGLLVNAAIGIHLISL